MKHFDVNNFIEKIELNAFCAWRSTNSFVVREIANHKIFYPIVEITSLMRIQMEQLLRKG